jgi:hypothetical protein
MYAYETQENVVKLSQKIGDILMNAMSQNRELDAEEVALILEMQDQITELRPHLSQPAAIKENKMRLGYWP